jgi:hypothetical protein
MIDDIHTADLADDDVVDDVVTDVLAEDEVVHVPAAAEELAESLEHYGETFLPEVSDWDGPDPA